MDTILDPGISRQASFRERERAHVEWLENEANPINALRSIVMKLGLNLERIVGANMTDRMFSELAQTNGDWRNALKIADDCSDWDLAQHLTILSAYAVFGLLYQGEEELVSDTINKVENLLTDCPADQWLEDPDNNRLQPVVTMARARLNLDGGHGVSAEGLALLGGVKLTRVRNMMSGNAPELPKDSTGLLANDPARAWLQKRDCFLPTMSKPRNADVDEFEEKMMAPVFLPVSRDGSMFTPDLKRAGHYQVGEKGGERQYDHFEDALAALQAMSVARWRRPNSEGNWGIVSAVEWRRVDRKTL